MIYPHVPAAFINAIAEEGTKAEAIEYLQRQWNKTCALREALETCESWIDRWTSHVASCEGGDKCTCGRTAILYEVRAALNLPQP